MAGQRIVALSLLAAGCASSPAGKPGSEPRSALPALHDTDKASSIQIRQVCEDASPPSDETAAPRLLAGDGTPSPCVPAPASDDDVRVEIDAVVDPGGRVSRARIVRSHPRCDEPCLASTYRQTFLPSRKGGRTTNGSATLVCRWGSAAGRPGDCFG
jgi:hypothetical protein